MFSRLQITVFKQVAVLTETCLYGRQRVKMGPEGFTGALNCSQTTTGVEFYPKLAENRVKIPQKLRKLEKNKFTAPGIPRRSPIQVLTGLDVA